MKRGLWWKPCSTNGYDSIHDSKGYVGARVGYEKYFALQIFLVFYNILLYYLLGLLEEVDACGLSILLLLPFGHLLGLILHTHVQLSP